MDKLTPLYARRTEPVAPMPTSPNVFDELDLPTLTKDAMEVAEVLHGDEYYTEAQVMLALVRRLAHPQSTEPVAACFAELLRGLEVPPGWPLVPHAYYALGKAIAEQAKAGAHPQRTEPAPANGQRVLCWWSEEAKMFIPVHPDDIEPAPVEREGWQLVPTVATKEMADAYWNADQLVDSVWAAMLAAAPKGNT